MATAVHELEQIAEQIYKQLNTGKVPEMSIPTRSKNNITKIEFIALTFCSLTTVLGKFFILNLFFSRFFKFESLLS